LPVHPARILSPVSKNCPPSAMRRPSWCRRPWSGPAATRPWRHDCWASPSRRFPNDWRCGRL